MIKQQVLEVGPEFLPLFLMAYVAAYVVFDRTHGNIVLAGLTLVIWNISSIAVVYWYYDAF